MDSLDSRFVCLGYILLLSNLSILIGRTPIPASCSRQSARGGLDVLLVREKPEDAVGETVKKRVDAETKTERSEELHITKYLIPEMLIIVACFPSSWRCPMNSLVSSRFNNTPCLSAFLS